MGNLAFGSNFLTRAKAFWGWFVNKSPAFIVLTSLTAVSVFGFGVGGTLAATGIIPNPFTSEALPETIVDLSEPTSTQPGSGFSPSESDEWQALTCDFTQGFNETTQVCTDEFARRANLLQDSGWTGVKYDFSKDGLYVFWLAQVTFAERPILVVEINGKELVGRWRGEGADPSTPCRPTDPHGYCQGVLNYVFNQKEWLRTNYAACQPGGDTFVVQVSGGGFNFRETGTLPPEVFDCPAAESTPSPTPTTEPSPTPTTEPSPTPTTEPSPTPTTEPSQ